MHMGLGRPAFRGAAGAAKTPTKGMGIVAFVGVPAFVGVLPEAVRALAVTLHDAAVDASDPSPFGLLPLL